MEPNRPLPARTQLPPGAGIAMLVIVADRGWRRSWYMRGGLVLVAAILVATIVHADSFDLSAHPLQIVYPLAYVVALPGATGSLL